MPRDDDISYRLLRLEQQLESYQKLHAEELNEIRKSLLEIRQQILSNDLEEDIPPRVEATDERTTRSMVG